MYVLSSCGVHPLTRSSIRKFEALVLYAQEKSKDASAPKMRIVAYNGDWSCECGKVNRLWDTCSCGQAGPCRDWVRGRCKYGQECR